MACLHIETNKVFSYIEKYNRADLTKNVLQYLNERVEFNLVGVSVFAKNVEVSLTEKQTKTLKAENYQNERSFEKFGSQTESFSLCILVERNGLLLRNFSYVYKLVGHNGRFLGYCVHFMPKFLPVGETNNDTLNFMFQYVDLNICVSMQQWCSEASFSECLEALEKFHRFRFGKAGHIFKSFLQVQYNLLRHQNFVMRLRDEQNAEELVLHYCLDNFKLSSLL